MPRYPRIARTIPAFFLLLGTTTLLAKESFTPQHVAKVRTVLAARISPDGKQVAYVLNVPRKLFEEKDGPAWTEIHLVDLEGKSRPFVTGQVNVGSVAWTPDGKNISFLAKRTGDANRSLYVIPLAGGEARKVLEHGSSISGYSWSPDGKQVAFLATEPETAEEKALKDKGFSQQIFEEDSPSTRIWVATIGSDDKARLIDVPGSASELHWSPAGKKLAVALAKTPTVDDHLMFRKVRIIDVASGKISAKLENPGKISQIAWSPDGKHVALVSAADLHDPREGRLYVAPAAGGKWRNHTPDYLGHVQSLAWKDPTTIICQTADGVWSSLREVRLDAKGWKTLIPAGGPIMHGLTLSADGKTAALLADTPTHPLEVHLVNLGGNKLKRLTNSNSWLKDMEFARQEVVKHKARDGLDLEGILIRPLGEKKGTRYPLILTVHGGPEAHISNGWITRYAYPGQVGAARGFAVFYPNYRGSTGRGVAFSKMGQRDAAGKEFDDLVDAVDHLVKTGLADTKKVGITGGSYGGYASAWAATYYTKRFAASVMFVGLSDNISMYGTTDIPYEMNLVHHRKWLWEDWDYFKKRSPVNYVEQARTPTLILHGKSDPRVPPSQSYELHRHLKVLGKTPVRLVLYPGEGHGNRRGASRHDYNLRMLRWMEYYLKGPGGKLPPYQLEYQMD